MANGVCERVHIGAEMPLMGTRRYNSPAAQEKTPPSTDRSPSTDRLCTIALVFSRPVCWTSGKSLSPNEYQRMLRALVGF
jgi:hypothetical protein